MKQISVVITIILILVAAVFFMRDRGARQELAAAQKQVSTLSNEVARIKTVMMMHSATNSILQEQITNHLGRLAGLSNRLAKVSENLKQAQEEHASAGTELDKQTKWATNSELLADELETEIRTVHNMLQNRDIEIGRLTARIKEAESELAAFRARLQKAEADVVRLQLDQTDEAALRAQLKRLDRQWPPIGFARPPKQSVTSDAKGAQSLTAKVDTQAKGYYLQMQPDGTVRLLPPFEAAGATAK